MNKISQSLYEAHMMGDIESANAIKDRMEELAQNAKPKQNVIQFNTVLNDDKSSAKRIYDFLNKELGVDWWEWETETIDHMLWIKFSTALEDINREKVLAIRHLCNNDQPFWDWYEFNQIALAFSGSMADFEFLKKPSPGMIINAVKSMNHIRPDRQGQFNDGVVKYICVMLKDDGIYTPPPSLYNLISDNFKELVSSEMKSLWKKVYDIYHGMVNKRIFDAIEEVEYIQARRIFSAEAAALSYGS
jgi:hypothetical protein